MTRRLLVVFFTYRELRYQLGPGRDAQPASTRASFPDEPKRSNPRNYDSHFPG